MAAAPSQVARGAGGRVRGAWLAAPAWRQREATLERLVARVVAGENLLRLCHCRGSGGRHPLRGRQYVGPPVGDSHRAIKYVQIQA